MYNNCCTNCVEREIRVEWCSKPDKCFLLVDEIYLIEIHIPYIHVEDLNSNIHCIKLAL